LIRSPLLRAFKPSASHTTSWQPAWITADLAVSAAPAAHHLHDIHAAGINSIVDLREGQEPGYHLEDDAGDSIVRMNVPTREGDAPTASQLDVLTAWIKARFEAHGPVLIHCREGRGRSALVACATLVRMGFSAESAFAIARRAHPRMRLSDAQHQALEDFARSWAPSQKERQSWT
jgi:protein-tyrosine phosphatase